MGLWQQMQKAEARQSAPKIAPRKLESISAPVSGKSIAKPEGKRKLGRPLAKDKASTLSALRPWIAEGMSRATWYRRQSKRPGE